MFEKISVKEIIKETASSSSIVFDVPEGSGLLPFKSGQYLVIKTEINGEELRRSYSISSVATEGLRIGVKKLEGGRVSTFLNDDVRVGDELEIMGPDGNFVSDENAVQHVFFAAGSGITPVISIIKDLLQNQEEPSVVLFYANSSPEHAMYKSEIQALAENERFDVHWIFSRDGAELPIYSGRIDFEKATELVHRFTDADVKRAFYNCGPAGMMSAVQTALEVVGISKDQIHQEYFTTPGDEKKESVGEKIQEPAAGSFSGQATIKVHLDFEEIEVSVHTTGDSILNTVLDAGHDAPFSCKGGVCTTCRAMLLKGTVHMDSNYALTDADLKEGHILTCQSHPTSPEVEISYDEV